MTDASAPLSELVGFAHPSLQVEQIVAETLEMVELTSLQHSVVGEPGGPGLSIEQRKRMSIAVELVANPSVVFME